MTTSPGIDVARRRGRAAAPRLATAQTTALLDALLDIRPRRTALDLRELACVDGLLFGRSCGEPEFRHYLGPQLEAIDTIERMTNCLALSPREGSFAFAALAEIPDVEPAFDEDETA